MAIMDMFDPTLPQRVTDSPNQPLDPAPRDMTDLYKDILGIFKSNEVLQLFVRIEVDTETTENDDAFKKEMVQLLNQILIYIYLSIHISICLNVEYNSIIVIKTCETLSPQ